MSFTVEMLPAGHGDALVVEWKHGRSTRRMLIDAGTAHAWEGVRQRLLDRGNERYDVFVVTHVDEDHIGGAISLLDDFSLRSRIRDVWFNGYVHLDRTTTSVLGPVNGEELTERIARGAFRWNRGFSPAVSRKVGGPVVVPDDGALPTVELDGARVVLLSPTRPKLDRLAPVWKEVVERAGLVAGSGSGDHTSAPGPSRRHADPLPDPLDDDAIRDLAGQNGSDGSEANGSSIAFVLEVGDARLCLAGDAHASVLAAGLKRYGKMIGEAKPRIDLFKLSHHGSKANVSKRLLGSMRCRRFLICTNGDTFNHPNDATIAKVLVAADSEALPIGFYCNYRSPRTAPWGERGAAVGADFAFPADGDTHLTVEVRPPGTR